MIGATPKRSEAELGGAGLPTPAAPPRPSVIRFYPYQREFFADQHRVQVAIWCRQAGKDFTTACKAVDNALRTHQSWYIVSMTQRQADETFSKCKAVAEVLKAAAKITGEIAAEDGAAYIDYDERIDQEFRCQARILHLPGGGKVVSLPGKNPDNLAGLTGNVIFTEFGLFPKGGYEHWRVVFPLSTRGFKVIVISTPRGKNTKLFELASQPDKYSVHMVDIHRAVADGMPLAGDDGQAMSIEAYRELYGDEVGWQREYLCQFSGDLESLVKWAQLAAAGTAGGGLPFDLVRVESDAGWKPGLFAKLAGEAEGRPEIGWDVARHSDLSAVWINLATAGKQRRLRYLILMHKTTFALQRTIIREVLDARADAVGCGDATGLGMDSNETLTNGYPGRWVGHTFTTAGKREIGSLLMTAFDEQSQAIPPVDGPHKCIATDIYAVQKEGGRDNLILSETDNPLLPDSHCDVAYAGGLALKAGQLMPEVGHLWTPDY